VQVVYHRRAVFFFPIFQDMHALTLVLNLISTFLSPFHNFKATFLSLEVVVGVKLCIQAV